MSFHIINYPYNESLQDPHSEYYRMLHKNVSDLFSEIYRPIPSFVGASNIQFRQGSVAVSSILTFRNSSINAEEVKQQFQQHSAVAFGTYGWNITKNAVTSGFSPSSAPHQTGVPGWGIALLVLVSVVVALAILYLLMLAVCQCRRKSYGELDLLPHSDAYHAMSEYPTYHTHGRYVPPGSNRRSPYEEVSAGNGGSSFSYTNPAATSANL